MLKNKALQSRSCLSVSWTNVGWLFVGNSIKEKQVGQTVTLSVQNFNGRTKFHFCSKHCKIHTTTSVYLPTSVL